METTLIPQFQLHHRLALAMEWADVENTDMAAELGVHRNTLSNYLNGHTRPSRSVHGKQYRKIGKYKSE